jgi:hypothetical protein
MFVYADTVMNEENIRGLFDTVRKLSSTCETSRSVSSTRNGVWVGRLQVLGLARGQAV